MGGGGTFTLWHVIVVVAVVELFPGSLVFPLGNFPKGSPLPELHNKAVDLQSVFPGSWEF